MNQSFGVLAVTSAGAFFAAWILIIVGLMVLSSTKWGRPIVAYTLWLMIILVLVTHWATITEILSPQTTGIPVQPLPQAAGTLAVPVYINMTGPY